jgi:hypothetical protein
MHVKNDSKVSFSRRKQIKFNDEAHFCDEADCILDGFPKQIGDISDFATMGKLLLLSMHCMALYVDDTNSKNDYSINVAQNAEAYAGKMSFIVMEQLP